MGSLAYHREYNKARYHIRRQAFIEQLGGQCLKCGSRKALEIDHIDPTQKSYDVGRFWALRIETVTAELSKCQLLCKACHISKTRSDNGQTDARTTHGTLSSYRYCKCALCREAKARWTRFYRLKSRAKSVPKKR